MTKIIQYLFSINLKFITAAVPLITALMLFSSCSNSPDIIPPVTGSDGIESTLLHSVQGPPSGVASVDEIFMVWHLQATTEQIENATSGTQVYEGLEWHTGQSERLQKTLKFLPSSDAFNKFQPFISDIVDDPNVRYAYREFWVNRDGSITGVAVWVCSPRANKIAYLSCP
jgi:hypothetical protein